MSAIRQKKEHMTVLGKLITVVGWAVFAIAGLWGFFLCFAIISKVVGFWGLVASLILGPVTFFAAPLYAGFVWGNWFPLAIDYGGCLIGAIFVGIGSVIPDDNKAEEYVSKD